MYSTSEHVINMKWVRYINVVYTNNTTGQVGSNIGMIVAQRSG